MKDQIAIVTGASSGIGATIAATLTKAGATVIGASRRRDGFARLDVTDPASCTALVAEVLARHYLRLRSFYDPPRYCLSSPSLAHSLSK